MATCKDCLHYEACKKFNKIRTNVINDSERGAKNLSRFMELPCKVGDVVYSVETAFTIPIEGKIYEVCIRSGITCFKVARKGYFSLGFTENDIGKTVFFTREEAEAALSERMKENG